MKIHSIKTVKTGQKFTFVSGALGAFAGDISLFVERENKLETKRFSHENGIRLIYTHGGRFDLEGRCTVNRVAVELKI